MDEMFRGITLLQMVQDDEDRVRVVNAVNSQPAIEMWWGLFPHLQQQHLTSQSISKANQQYLWVARPPGIWVTIVRYENELIATSGFIPIEAEWNKVHALLKEHGAALICRASQEIGLVPVFVQAPQGEITPLATGFGLKAAEAIKGSPLDNETKAVVELEEVAVDWPNGLTKPYIIGLDTAKKLMDEEFRAETIKKYTGVWLLAPNEIYEVRS